MLHKRYTVICEVVQQKTRLKGEVGSLMSRRWRERLGEYFEKQKSGQIIAFEEKLETSKLKESQSHCQDVLISKG
jgi:hypothetical protein